MSDKLDAGHRLSERLNVAYFQEAVSEGDRLVFAALNWLVARECDRLAETERDQEAMQDRLRRAGAR